MGKLSNFIERHVVDNYLIIKYEHAAKKEREEDERVEALVSKVKRIIDSTGITAEEAIAVIEISDDDKEILLERLSGSD